MSSIQVLCFQFQRIYNERKTPIKKLSLTELTEKVNNFVPAELNTPQVYDSANFYKFDISCFYNIFNANEYPSILILPSIEEMHSTSAITEITKIIITVGCEGPSRGIETINSIDFELRVICIMKSSRMENKPSKFDAVRYMRHGNGNSSWWKQERKDKITTKYIDSENIFLYLFQPSEDCFFYQYLNVYVKIGDDDNDNWRMKFLESMGGKSHVLCQCSNFPLIPSNFHKSKKSKCNFKHFVTSDGTLHNKEINCSKLESYICTNVQCNLKICNSCYRKFSTEDTTKIVPPRDSHMNSISMQETDNFESTNDYDNDDSESENTTDDEESSYNSTLSEVSYGRISEFVTHCVQDTTLDLTIDNQNFNDDLFETTNSADIPLNINQHHHSSDTISGHVIFNQVGHCTIRRNQGSIEGTSRQKYFVQNLCATTPGQSFPLLQPEASLFPRHFYASAQLDSCSILGAQPIFLMSSKKNTYGFTSTLTQARIHMTNPSSTTSTDPNHMCFYFDQLGNLSLNHIHSRDIFERGFVVDNNSYCGMSVRDKGKTELAGSIDSRQMVQNLSSSQKYIKYTWFLTFTANQSEHPGIHHLHKWKNSLEWASRIDKFNTLSLDEKKEYIYAIEQAYGNHLYSNWNIVKYMLLHYIKEQCTVLGTVTAIFARDEYQKHAGNICHNHLIIAVDKSTMNENTQQFIQDLIRTSVMEIVKSDSDIERLINEGLLKSIDDIPKIEKLAGTILTHKCDERCKMRVGHGDSEKDFRCRKLHNVRDTPDPTKHCLIPIGIKFQKTTLEVLEDIGIFIPSSLDIEKYNQNSGSFTHSYFAPKRHMPPCNFNAKCNISPVIVDFFIATKSMQNVQALDHTNGLSKYVCKYIAKFDDGNYVVVSQNIHNGNIVLGKTHLHNTKIARSNINEQKAYEKNRKKKHPRGRDMPHFEIRQLLMGHPEVFTNIEFIRISTLPFELRPQNSICVDNIGNVSTNYTHNHNHPPDAFNTELPMQRLRIQKNLPPHQCMTTNQIITYRNHNGSSTSYDMISIFALRPPELLGVFTNPVDYFRLCHIKKKNNERRLYR